MSNPRATNHQNKRTETRMGPRPLSVHLSTANAISMSSLSAWPPLKSGWTPWSENLHEVGSALQKELAAVNPDEFGAALLRELSLRHDAFLSGLENYRDHPHSRTIEPPPPLWESGPVQLLDYGTTHPNGATGRPLLIVPSLINRGYILDLAEDRSFLRYLAAQGFRPLLIDWGTPDAQWLERSLDDIIAKDMVDCLEVACECAGGPVATIGYCMGGTMAVALAALAPKLVSALVLLAAPWDFHVGTDGPPPFVTAGRPVLESVMSATGHLPVDILQTLFFSIDPVQSWRKFRSFSAGGQKSSAAGLFVALEDWLNDGVPLGAAVGRQCLFDWYGENTPARNLWSIHGKPVLPAELDLPTLAIIPARDRIVPPASALALADAIPGAETISLAAGHIGMMVGGKAQTALWSPLQRWLSSLE